MSLVVCICIFMLDLGLVFEIWNDLFIELIVWLIKCVIVLFIWFDLEWRFDCMGIIDFY